MASRRGFDSNEPIAESWQLPNSPFNPDNKDLLGARNPRDVYWMPDGFGIVVYQSVVNEAGQALEQWHPIRLACEHWAPKAKETLDCRFGCASRIEAAS